MSDIERIGIIGASGDLGQHLTVQACATFQEVFTFDIDPQRIARGTRGVDREVRRRSMKVKPQAVGSVDELLSLVDIVHFAAPIGAIESVDPLLVPDGTLLTLHDSVMDNSLREARKIESTAGFAGSVATVHCLMNRRRTVVVGTDTGDVERATSHIAKLELRPVQLAVDDHDLIMAESQAPMAILHELLAGNLARYDAAGLLTESGHDLRTALTSRAAKWRPNTLKSIFTNKQIPGVLERMAGMVIEKQNGGDH